MGCRRVDHRNASRPASPSVNVRRLEAMRGRFASLFASSGYARPRVMMVLPCAVLLFSFSALFWFFFSSYPNTPSAHPPILFFLYMFVLVFFSLFRCQRLGGSRVTLEGSDAAPSNGFIVNIQRRAWCGVAWRVTDRPTDRGVETCGRKVILQKKMKNIRTSESFLDTSHSLPFPLPVSSTCIAIPPTPSIPLYSTRKRPPLLPQPPSTPFPDWMRARS